MAIQRTLPIWQLIRAHRQRSGNTQYSFADALAAASGNHGITREQVARWERGKRIPSPYWRRFIAEVLHLPREQVERSAVAGRRDRLAARCQAGSHRPAAGWNRPSGDQGSGGANPARA